MGTRFGTRNRTDRRQDASRVPHPPSESGACIAGSFARSLASDVRPDYIVGMAESLQLTIVYEDTGDGWIVASIPEVPGAHSQGHTRAEARENVIDALHGILELRFGEHALTEPASDSEPLELTIAA